VMDGRIVGARFLLAFPRGRTPLVLPPKRKAARTWANFFFFFEKLGRGQVAYSWWYCILGTSY